MKGLMKIKKIISFLLCVSLVMCFCANTAFAEDNEILKIFDFEKIENISEYPEFSGTSNSSKGVSSAVSDGVFTIGKHASATHSMYVDFTQYIGEKTTYSVKLDIMPSFASGKNFMVRFGAIIQLVSKGNGKYVIQRMTDGKFVTENQTEFTFSDLTSGLAFAVKDKTTVDAFYVKNGELTLIYGDMEYVENSSTKAGNLGFTFNKSADGDISMDNVTLSDGALKISDPDPDEPVNDITKFEFTNISTDIFADEGETLNLPVTAEATSGIEKIEVYIDGEIYETLTDTPYVITLQNIDRGSVTVTAKAVSSGKSESEISSNVNFASVDNAYTVFEDSDFADGEGNVLKSGISMYSRRGTVKKDTADQDRGTSLFVGADIPDTSYSSSDIPYIDIPLKSTSGRVNISYDLYIDKKDSSGRKTMVLRLSNDKDTNIVRFTNSEMKLLNNLVTEYSEGKWYHFSVKADTVQNTVSVFVNGVPYFCKSMLSSSNSDGNQSLKLLRLYGPGEENAGFTAIDNIKVTGFYDLPSVTDLTEENGKIYAKLSSGIFAGSIDESTVCLKNSKGKDVLLENVYYDESKTSVVITPAKKLVPSAKYTVEISENAMIADGVYFGEKVLYEFNAKSDTVEVSAYNVSVSGGICKGEVSVKNTSDNKITVFAVMALFNGTKCEKMRIEPITLEKGETKTAVLQGERGSADCAQIYIYSDVFASKLLGEILKKSF